MVLSDEIYEYIMFDGAHGLDRRAARHARAHHHGQWILQGLCHDRLAAGLSPQQSSPSTKAMVRMQSTITTGANQFVQRAAIAALEGPREEVERMRLRYRARRDMVLAGLRAIEGVRIGDIPATFYAFPDVSALLGRKAGNHVMDTTDRLCDWLLEEHGVAVVPGTAFGAPGSIRLSFAASEADIQKALGRISSALNSLV